MSSVERLMDDGLEPLGVDSAALGAAAPLLEHDALFNPPAVVPTKWTRAVASFDDKLPAP